MKELLEVLLNLKGDTKRIIVKESPIGADVLIENNAEVIALNVKCTSRTHYDNVNRVVDFYMESIA